MKKPINHMTKMQTFLDTLQLEDAGMDGSSRVFKLMSRFRIITSRGVITVPKGFLTDGASVPKMFWSIFDPFGEYFRAAVLHDFLYSTQGCAWLTRKECDDLFKEAMFNAGVPWVKRDLIYRTVRMFGGSRFRKPETKNK